MNMKVAISKLEEENIRAPLEGSDKRKSSDDDER